jgi:hypothetical protein
LFGDVKRSVGLAQQGWCVHRMQREGRDAEAASDRVSTPGTSSRAIADRSFSATASAPDRGEDVVALFVSEAVVDLLEMIEVERDRRERREQASRVGNHAAQGVVQRAT